MKETKIKNVGFENIAITDGFWKEKQDLFRDVTLDAIYQRFKETGRFEALKCNWKKGMPFEPHIFWESDVTKWIEGAAYFLQKERDAELEARIDALVEDMYHSQEKNGYLNEYFTVVEPEARFTRRTDHELYCAGHLIEGAIAYAEATGKTRLLEVAEKYVALIDRVFRVEHSAAFDTPGHEEIELALVRLYRYTGKKEYLTLASYFIETRGRSTRDTCYEFADQKNMQSHLPVREQKTAEGHSVRALYLYSAMADIAMETKDQELLDACKTLFENITQKRMYITGGIGSTNRGESFTFDYDLPEYTAYSETCASIALAMFCRKMWMLDPDARYADCAERAIYNTVLSGVSLSGDRFFYENPLAADPERNAFNDVQPEGTQEHLPILQRVKVFSCSCCPPNLLRIVGSIADYMYSVSEKTIFAHCFMNANAMINLDGTRICLEQKTGYPYEGGVEIRVQSDAAFTLAVRVPEWSKTTEFYVNGEKAEPEMQTGYAYIYRNWKEGDTLLLKLDMRVKLFAAHPKVKAVCGRVAVMRGPIVYCAEQLDHGATSMRDVRISPKATFAVEYTVLGGEKMALLHTMAEKRMMRQELYQEFPYQTEKMELTLIPYHAWANRGVTEMTTWLLDEEKG
mgnify:FL=1